MSKMLEQSPSYVSSSPGRSERPDPSPAKDTKMPPLKFSPISKKNASPAPSSQHPVSPRTARLGSGRYSGRYGRMGSLESQKLPSIHLNRAPLRKELSVNRSDDTVGELISTHSFKASVTLPSDYKLYRKPEVSATDWKHDNTLQSWYKDLRLREKSSKLQQLKAEAKGDQRILDRISKQQKNEVMRKQKTERDAQRRIENERKWLKQVIMEEKKRVQEKELSGSHSSGTKLLHKFKSAGSILSTIQSGSRTEHAVAVGQKALAGLLQPEDSDHSDKTVEDEEEASPEVVVDVDDLEEEHEKAPVKMVTELQWQTVPEMNTKTQSPIEKDVAVWISPGVFVTKTVRVR